MPIRAFLSFITSLRTRVGIMKKKIARFSGSRQNQWDQGLQGLGYNI